MAKLFVHAKKEQLLDTDGFLDIQDHLRYAENEFKIKPCNLDVSLMSVYASCVTFTSQPPQEHTLLFPRPHPLQPD